MPYLVSIGDVIVLAQLIKELITALQDSKGSSAEYQECIDKLLALNQIVSEVEAICISFKNVDELNTQRDALLYTVQRCKRFVENVLQNTKKYDSSLSKGGSRNNIRDAWRKLEWRTLRSDQLAKIAVEVIYYCSIFSSHMSAASM